MPFSGYRFHLVFLDCGGAGCQYMSKVEMLLDYNVS